MESAHIKIDWNSRCLNYSPHNKNSGFCLQYSLGDVEGNGPRCITSTHGARVLHEGGDEPRRRASSVCPQHV